MPGVDKWLISDFDDVARESKERGRRMRNMLCKSVLVLLCATFAARLDSASACQGGSIIRKYRAGICNTVAGRRVTEIAILRPHPHVSPLPHYKALSVAYQRWLSVVRGLIALLKSHRRMISGEAARRGVARRGPCRVER